MGGGDISNRLAERRSYNAVFTSRRNNKKILHPARPVRYNFTVRVAPDAVERVTVLTFWIALLSSFYTPGLAAGGKADGVTQHIERRH